ncbi:MAG: ATPase-activating ribosome biosynthesis protein [Phylliscum demangeonii]|nr:MAG: ATPase-activating ribosome biosynthesis protein [Phylliscum demangeonii]
MRIVKCAFCDRPCYPSKGIMFVRNDGRSFRFCRSKCDKNVKWTRAFRRAAGKELVVDPVLQFGGNPNIPVRYNRDRIALTLSAMQRVAEIRERREKVFYLRRMAGNKERQRAANRKLVAENQHLLPPEARLAAELPTMETQEAAEAVVVAQPEARSKVATKTKSRKRLLVGGGVDDELEVA